MFQFFGASIFTVVMTFGLLAQEKIVLDPPPPSAADYRIEGVSMLWGPTTAAAEGLPATQTCEIAISLRPNIPSAPYIKHVYTGDAACTMLRALNKANLSTTSLQRRISDRLIADKVIAGTVVGTPE